MKNNVPDLTRWLLRPALCYSIFSTTTLIFLFGSSTWGRELEALSKGRSTSDAVVFVQANPVSGRVISSEDQSGIPGVNVVVVGSAQGTVTDVEGNYSIEVPGSDAVLSFSAVGFITQEILVSDQSTIDVSLEPDVTNLDEVVVVGYATTKRKNILGAVSSVKEKQVEQVTPVNAFDAIQGRLAGVNIISNGGPGAGSTIQIRGISTFEGGVEPLYVVDGQQLDNIDNLDPNDIASLEVLKDGASAAIYGSKSANGVVIITTKSGKAGETKLNVDFNTVYSRVNSYVPIASTRQRIFYEDVRRDDATILTGQERDSLNLLYRNSNDLQALLFRTGQRQQMNVGVSGGGETGTFYWNSGFLNEEGVVINSGYRRFNTQFKIDSELFDKVKVGTTLYASYELIEGLSEGQVFQQVVERIPYFPVFEPNGDFTPEIAGRQNPVAEAAARRMDDRRFSARSFNYAEWQIIPQLSIRSTLGINFRLRKRNDFDPTIVLRVGNSPQGRERNGLEYDLLQENFATYRQAFGDHAVSVILGNSVQQWTSEDTDLRSNSFLSDDVETFNAIEADGFLQNDTRTFRDGHSLLGYFATASYNYQEKYLLEGTLRRDASSRFGSNNRFALFKSGSVGWRISSENFMAGLSDQISNLLIRYSYGENGNERIGNYDNRTRYGFGNFYSGVNSIAPQDQLGNPDLKWENTISRNLGLALGMFDGRLNLDFNLYSKVTQDLLAEQNLPVESGYTTIRTNIGSVQNRGIELSISGSPVRINDFEWFTSFNISSLNNEVLDIPNEQGFFDDGIYRIEEGQPIGNMFGFKNLGIYQYDESNAYDENGTSLTPNFDDNGDLVNYTLNGQEYTGEVKQLARSGKVLLGGDIIWEDLNGDFEIDDNDDRQVIGNGLAKYFGGFYNELTYRNFSLSFLLDYNFGNDIFSDYDQGRNDLNSSNETPSPERIEGAWFQPGDVVEYAKLDRNRRFTNGLTNSAYVSQGDFIKLRNIRFAYQLDKRLLDNIGFVDNLSIDLSVNNLLTWTNYRGYNPELGTRGEPLQPGLDELRYPNKTDFIIGVRIGL